MLTMQNVSHDPFYNQAFEEYIYQTYLDDDIFLLWQNSPAVVGAIRTSAGRSTWRRCGSGEFPWCAGSAAAGQYTV